MIGITEFTNKLGIHVVGLDYIADPAKRSKEWEESAHEGLDERSWRKEYLRDWTVASGLPVYADDFVRGWHVATDELLAHQNLPMFRGWDMGPTHTEPACAIAQVDPLHRLDVLNELVTWDGRGDPKVREIAPFAEDVILFCNQCYPGVEWIDYADPASWTKAMTDGKSAVMILNRMGIHPRKGPVTFTDRKHSMIQTLTKASNGRASIMISPKCRMLIEGFEGAYKYEEIGETGRYKPTVEKNAWSHIMNGLEYIVGGLYAPPKREREQERRRTGKPSRVTGY